MCGIFQYRYMFAVGYVIVYQCTSQYTLIWKPFDGICVNRLYTALFLPEVMLSCVLPYLYVFFCFLKVFCHAHTQYSRGERSCVEKSNFIIKFYSVCYPVTRNCFSLQVDVDPRFNQIIVLSIIKSVSCSEQSPHFPRYG